VAPSNEKRHTDRDRLNARSRQYIQHRTDSLRTGDANDGVWAEKLAREWEGAVGLADMDTGGA
jgi:hypothetical protein